MQLRSWMISVLSVGLVAGLMSASAYAADNPTAKVGAPNGATVLFDGTDFSHWQKENGEEPGWKIEGDAMVVQPGTGSIVTKMPVHDFWLHLEFRIPESATKAEGQAKGNSGVYIQQRYEVQILDSYGEKPQFNGCASLYRYKAPDVNMSKPAGQWQTYDIFFRAARWEGEGDNAKKTQNVRVTVIQNGVVVQDLVELTRKTGAGQPEAPEDKPILLQDHGSKVAYRNIWILPFKHPEGVEPAEIHQ